MFAEIVEPQPLSIMLARKSKRGPYCGWSRHLISGFQLAFDRHRGDYPRWRGSPTPPADNSTHLQARRTRADLFAHHLRPAVAALIQSKLACGLDNLRRTHKDFADVVELIAIPKLDVSFARHLHDPMRAEFKELVRRAGG